MISIKFIWTFFVGNALICMTRVTFAQSGYSWPLAAADIRDSISGIIWMALFCVGLTIMAFVLPKNFMR